MSSTWVHHFSYSNVWYTKCFTLLLGNTSLGTDGFKDNIQFLLEPVADWYILLHDPTYYLMAFNKMTTPGIKLSYKSPPAGEWRMSTIQLTEHNRINRVDRRCQEEPDYRLEETE